MLNELSMNDFHWVVSDIVALETTVKGYSMTFF